MQKSPNLLRSMLQAILIISIISITNPILAQTKKQNIEKLMTYTHKEGLFNGTVLVAENGKAIYVNAFGSANLRTKQPLNTATPFCIGSVSKQFTSMAVMILKEQGKLSFQDKLSDYFTGFPDYAKRAQLSI